MSRTPRPYHLAGNVPTSPAASILVPAEAVVRFLARLEPADGGCMTLRRLSAGRSRTSAHPQSYGRVLWNDEHGNTHQIRAHRLALMLKLGGPIPDGMQALHRCDNQACVAGLHLYGGTFQDNMDDRMRARHAQKLGAVPKLHPTRHHYRSRPARMCSEVRAG